MLHAFPYFHARLGWRGALIAGGLWWTGVVSGAEVIDSGTVSASPTEAPSIPKVLERVEVLVRIVEAPSQALAESLDEIGLLISGDAARRPGGAVGAFQGTIGEDRADAFTNALAGVPEVVVLTMPKLGMRAGTPATLDASQEYPHPKDSGLTQAQPARVGLRLELVAGSMGETVGFSMKGVLSRLEALVRAGAREQPVFSERVFNAAAELPLGSSLVWGLGRGSGGTPSRETVVVLKVAAPQ